jgi:DNA-binding transcriptional regulator YdaS (Cro superfamily)
VINAKVMAVRLGINPTLLAQYIQGVKKPSEKQTQKILAGIKQVGKELYELELA